MLKNPSYDKLFERARGAAIDMRLLIAAVRGRFSNAYPSVVKAERWNSFLDYGLVAGCFTMSIGLHFYVQEDLRTALELEIRKGLEAAVPKSEALWKELHNFYLDKFLPLSREERSQKTLLIPAVWTIRSVGAWESIQDDERMIGELEDLFRREVREYWEVCEDHSKN